jgi:hypothetical protein
MGLWPNIAREYFSYIFVESGIVAKYCKGIFPIFSTSKIFADKTCDGSFHFGWASDFSALVSDFNFQNQSNHNEHA